MKSKKLKGVSYEIRQFVFLETQRNRDERSDLPPTDLRISRAIRMHSCGKPVGWSKEFERRVIAIFPWVWPTSRAVPVGLQKDPHLRPMSPNAETLPSVGCF